MYIGWMSNWQYAQITPTAGWRSAMTVPRELSLRRVNDRLVLIQRPVAELSGLRTETFSWNDLQIEAEGTDLLGSAAWECYELVAEFEIHTATEFGFRVRKSESHATVIGYDVLRQAIFVDRSHSGEDAFHPLFAGTHTAELAPDLNNRVTMHIWVDRSSVEVFANDGLVAITDLIFPNPQDQGIEPYAVNGNVRLVSLHIYPIR
jgi:fructan beta-fructosidase